MAPMYCSNLYEHSQVLWPRDPDGDPQCPFENPVTIEGYPGIYWDFDLDAERLTGFDDAARQATVYEPGDDWRPGNQIEVRPYTDEENARADALASDAAVRQAQADLDRAVQLNSAPDELKALQEASLAQEGIQEGDPWRQPTGAHDAYPLGAIVSHVGKTWESLIAANVWEPGAVGSESLWKDTTPLPEDEWDPNGHAYLVGDQVTYQGPWYQCLIAHTSQPDWAPPLVPALWQPIPDPEED